MDDFEIIDRRFGRFVMFNAPVERLATGFRWAEGPVWFGDRETLLWSDIPNDRIMAWSEATGTYEFRRPAQFANGHNRDREGRLISCEHGARRVTRTEHDGRITVIADAHDGKRLNSPNDLVCHSDGSIWFTDPHYGIASNYEGHEAEQEQPCHVYRVDPSGRIEAVVTDFACPNGIAFSPDETRLYVAETGPAFTPHAERHIRAFDVGEDGRLSGGDVFHTVEPGLADGFRCDVHGNLWTSAGDGVHCLTPRGELIGKVKVPEIVSNVCFGGRGRHRLFITATTSVYSVALATQGARWVRDVGAESR